MRMRMCVALVACVGLSWVVQDVGAQQVTGRVASPSGEPLAAVQVFIAGSGIGALSQQNGRYLLLNVPVGTHTITAQRIGYREQTVEITVAAGATVVRDFVLSEQALGLDEIVVTGTVGGTRRRAVGNAVTSISVGSELATMPIGGKVDGLLSGRTPGVTIMGLGSVSGGGNIRIRGQSTFSLSTNPLVYIDGIRVSNAENTGLFDDAGGGRSILSTLDPNEIESMEILKGPSAATLYGTQASRGVIQIITKKGQQGGRTVNMTMRQGVNFMGPPAHDRIGETRYHTTASGQVQSLDVLKRWEDKGMSPFGTGQVQEYNLSASGGTAAMRYFMSSSYLDEHGYVEADWNRRFSLRLNTEADLGDDLRMSLSTGYTQGTSRRPMEGYNNKTANFVFGGPRWLAENLCVTQPSSVCDVTDGAGSYGLAGVGSLHGIDEAVDNQQGVNRFVGSATTSWDTFDWLSTRLILGIDFANEDNTQTVEHTRDPVLMAGLRRNADGYREVLRNQRALTTTDFSMTADFGLGSSLNSNFSIGAQYYTRSNTSMYVRGNGFPVPGLKVVDAAAQTILRRTTDNGALILSDNKIEDRTFGMYVQETLAWKDRLFLTGAVRVDNNSAFGSDINLVTYPKASVSWVINEESWFPDSDFLSAMRFRLAYGQSGEQPPAFAAVQSYTPVPSPYGGGITTFTSGNPALAPEVGSEIETGFDLGLFGGRMDIEATYYNTVTRDAILKRDVAPSSGFSQAVFVNLGQVSSQGFEIAVDGLAINREGFRWNLGGHVAYNEAKIDRLGTEANADTAIIYGIWNIREHRVGYAPHQWFGPQLVSAVWDSGKKQIANEICRDGSGGTMACYNADGTLAAPRLFIGHTIAPWELALSSEMAFGDALRFNLQVVSYRGHERFDNNMRQRYGGFRNTHAGAYPEQASPQELLRLAAAQSGDVIMSPFINDVSYTRLQEASLSWTLPREKVEGFGIAGASLTIAGRNLWTWTNWEDNDPSVNRPNGDDRMFFSQHPLPTPTTVETTLRITL